LILLHLLVIAESLNMLVTGSSDISCSLLRWLNDEHC
jgi:hypothetical protein